MKLHSVSGVTTNSSSELFIFLSNVYPTVLPLMASEGFHTPKEGFEITDGTFDGFILMILNCLEHDMELCELWQFVTELLYPSPTRQSIRIPPYSTPTIEDELRRVLVFAIGTLAETGSLWKLDEYLGIQDYVENNPDAARHVREQFLIKLFGPFYCQIKDLGPICFLHVSDDCGGGAQAEFLHQHLPTYDNVKTCAYRDLH